MKNSPSTLRKKITMSLISTDNKKCCFIFSNNLDCHILSKIGLPVILIAGPIIALIGLVLSWIINSIRCKQLRYSYNQKLKEHTIKQSNSEYLLDLSSQTIIHFKNLINKRETKLKKDLTHWCKRLIPFAYSIEIIRCINRACYTSIPSQKIPTKEIKPLSVENHELKEKIRSLVPEIKDLLSDKFVLSTKNKNNLEQLLSTLEDGLSIKILPTTKKENDLIDSLKLAKKTIKAVKEAQITITGLLSLKAQQVIEDLLFSNPKMKQTLDALLLKAKDLLSEESLISPRRKKNLKESIKLFEIKLLTKDKTLTTLHQELRKAITAASSQNDLKATGLLSHEAQQILIDLIFDHLPLKTELDLLLSTAKILLSCRLGISHTKIAILKMAISEIEYALLELASHSSLMKEKITRLRDAIELSQESEDPDTPLSEGGKEAWKAWCSKNIQENTLNNTTECEVKKIAHLLKKTKIYLSKNSGISEEVQHNLRVTVRHFNQEIMEGKISSAILIILTQWLDIGAKELPKN